MKGKKLRKGRCIFVLTLFFVLCNTVAFDELRQAEAAEQIDMIQVVVRPGDTLWELVEDHCDYEGDIRKAVHKVERLNGLNGGSLQVGQSLLLPADIR